MAMLVQLLPFRPKLGFVLRRYNYKGQVFSNEATPNRWFAVSDEVAAYLKDVHSNPNDPSSPLAFKVANFEEAKAFEEDQGRKMEKQTLDDYRKAGGDLSSADLPVGGGGTGRGGYGAVARGEGGGLGDPNVGESQNHYRPQGSHGTDRGGQFETHGGDPSPAPAGQSPDMSKRLGTPENPTGTNSATPGDVPGTAAAQGASVPPAAGEQPAASPKAKK